MATLTSTKAAEVGFVVDAGPEVGYGHVVRCLRIAEGLIPDVRVSFYPLSEPCAQFLSEREHELRFDGQFPAITVSDLCRAHPVTDAIGS